MSGHMHTKIGIHALHAQVIRIQNYVMHTHKLISTVYIEALKNLFWSEVDNVFFPIW
jgi:hypothetical protein